ncbi:hypothetical protein AB0L25_11425 [Spirillospora sp. NPDC052242]
MGIWEPKEHYAGLPVFRFDQERLDAEAAALPDLPAAGATALLVGNWCAEYRDPEIYPVARLESLSLAMGTLTDRGAEALLSGRPLTHLRRLDLRHHFLSEGMAERVRAALPGVDVDLGDRQEPKDHDWFYVEVSE